MAWAAAWGYLMAVLLVTEAQNRLRSQAIPSAFRGMPITLIYIGVLALAIYGFTGHTVIPVKVQGGVRQRAALKGER